MKAFLAAVVFTALVAVGSWYGLNNFTQWGANDRVGTRDSVRLD